MKLTKEQLKQIIKEELKSLLEAEEKWILRWSGHGQMFLKGNPENIEDDREDFGYGEKSKAKTFKDKGKAQDVADRASVRLVPEKKE